jgi:hypothetical protein
VALEQREHMGEELRRGRDELRELREDLAEITNGLAQLARKEMELVQAELREQVGLSRNSLILAGLSLPLLLVTLVFCAAAGMLALDLVLPLWLAGLVTAGAALGLTIVVLLWLYTTVRRLSVLPKRTIHTLNEDAEWARSQLKLNAR